MAIEATRHALPDCYRSEECYEGRKLGLNGTPAEAAEKAAMVQSLLDKWDSIMNDPSIAQEDKDLFAAIFTGVMQKKEDRDDPFGVSAGEGFDDLLRALEHGDMEALDAIRGDVEDMGELLGAFAEAYQAAQQATSIAPQTDGARAAKMLFTGDLEGYRRERLEREAGKA
jgi:hypothetical protein